MVKQWVAVFRAVQLDSAVPFAGIANPAPAILSAGMRLEFLGEGGAAAGLHWAGNRLPRGGRARTPDVGGCARMAEVGDAVVAVLGFAA